MAGIGSSAPEERQLRRLANAIARALSEKLHTTKHFLNQFAQNKVEALKPSIHQKGTQPHWEQHGGTHSRKRRQPRAASATAAAQHQCREERLDGPGRLLRPHLRAPGRVSHDHEASFSVFTEYSCFNNQIFRPQYRVTIQVMSWAVLTSHQRLHFSIRSKVYK